MHRHELQYSSKHASMLMTTRFPTSCVNAKTDLLSFLEGHVTKAQGPSLNNSNLVNHAAALMSILWIAGHANVQTDIKEAIFLGQNDDLVAAGSDDGNVFIYDAKTGQIVKILQADADVANCVQVHFASAGSQW